MPPNPFFPPMTGHRGTEPLTSGTTSQRSTTELMAPLRPLSPFSLFFTLTPPPTELSAGRIERPTDRLKADSSASELRALTLLILFHFQFPLPSFSRPNRI